jgi:hypothetical protein
MAGLTTGGDLLGRHPSGALRSAAHRCRCTHRAPSGRVRRRDHRESLSDRGPAPAPVLRRDERGQDPVERPGVRDADFRLHGLPGPVRACGTAPRLPLPGLRLRCLRYDVGRGGGWFGATRVRPRRRTLPRTGRSGALGRVRSHLPRRRDLGKSRAEDLPVERLEAAMSTLRSRADGWASWPQVASAARP